MGWDSKLAFILSRILVAILGVVRTVAILRLLSFSDYALIGIVESVRSVIGTMLGFGVGDSFSREGAAEQNSRRRGQLLAVSYANGLGVSVLGGLAFSVVGLFGDYIYSDSRLTQMLCAAFVISVLERLWLVSLAALRVMDNHRAFLLFGFVYGILNTVLSVALVAYMGVTGYFYAQILNGAFLVVLVLSVVLREAVLPTVRDFVNDWREATVQLWDVSWFMYVFKGTTAIWRRIPILLSAPFVAPQLLGAVSAALDLGFKIHLLHQALSPLIIPRLTRAYMESKDLYRRLVRVDLFQVIALNVIALLTAVLGWRWIGPTLLTPDRWNLIGDMFYLALMVEATLVVTNISSMCVLLPTRQLDRLTIPTAGLRFATLPIFYLLLFAGLNEGQRILLSMLLPGILVAALYWLRAHTVLRMLSL